MTSGNDESFKHESMILPRASSIHIVLEFLSRGVCSGRGEKGILH